MLSSSRKHVAFFLLVAGAASARAEAPITLDELQSLARIHSPKLKSARAAVSSADADVRAAGALRGPRVDIGVFGRAATPFNVSVANGTVPLQLPLSGGANAMLTQPISDLYALTQNHAAAEHLRDATSLRAQAAENDLAATVAALYFRHAAAAAQVDHARAEVAAAQARRDVAASLATQGQGDMAAVLDAKLAVATSEAQTATAEAALDDGRAEIEALIGISFPAGRALSTTLEKPQLLSVPEKAEETAAQARFDVQAAEADAAAAERRCSAAAQDLYPQLAISAEAGPVVDAIHPPLWAAATANVRWTALDWGLSRAREDAACARAAQARQAALDTASEARTAVRQAMRADQTAQRRVDAQERALALATELSRVVADKAARGSATKAEALTAQARVADANAQLAAATAEWLTARVRIELALARQR